MELERRRGRTSDIYLDLVQKQNDSAAVLTSSCEQWLRARNKSLTQLASLAEDLDMHHSNVNKASLAGSSVSAVGGVSFCAGLILAPFTGGLSMVLTIGGAAASFGGGVTAFGASLTEFGITFARCKQIQNVLELDKAKTEKLIRVMDRFVHISNQLDEFIQTTCFTDVDLIEIAKQSNMLFKKAKLGKEAILKVIELAKKIQDPEVRKYFKMLEDALSFGGITIPNIGNLQLKDLKSLNLRKLTTFSINELKELAKGVFLNPAKLSRTAKFGMGAVSVVFVVVDIWSIVSTVEDMKNGSKTKVSMKIRELATKLEDGKQIINDIIYD
ncbi:uncharacterized protein LOC126813865 [Patella vulgata]|uniref:uncharacterized protein LOC126813865 n=1 Tax=Patella vulgata TaxID=6465 RepID=UPI0024A7C8F7|nr:uncharacterized protein LOC126813865 [Patella vulgata]XP_050395137.2 uncharacterized protein LOC126813865 [Patella vulgata]